MMSLDERLDKAEEMIQKPSFRENKGLGNEVGYYIFDYPAEKELYIRERIEYIKKKSENSDDDFKVVVFDLYDIMIDILIRKGYLEKCYQFEKTKGFERVSKSISNMLRITSSDSLIVNHIRDNTPEKALVFITGIGKCYPILRSHTVLNNLHQVIDNVPVVYKTVKQATVMSVGVGQYTKVKDVLEIFEEFAKLTASKKDEILNLLTNNTKE